MGLGSCDRRGALRNGSPHALSSISPGARPQGGGKWQVLTSRYPCKATLLTLLTVCAKFGRLLVPTESGRCTKFGGFERVQSLALASVLAEGPQRHTQVRGYRNADR